MSEHLDRRISHRSRTFALIATGFILPVLLICLVMLNRGIVPFGDISVFIWDAKLQHKDYLGYIIDILHGNASIQYSASKSLGGGIPGILGFYGSSPLNLLLFFFDKDTIPLFMSLVIILRIGLCGASSSYYLFHRFQIPAFAGIALSTAYALSEYNVYYCRNCMWLDGVILLPLAAYGTWLLVNEKKPLTLIISIFVSIISNWYTGYMVCLMTGLIFLIEYFLAAHQSFSIRSFFLCSRTFVSCILAGVGLSAFVLLPSCAALVNGKATNNIAKFDKILNFDLLHFFSGFDIKAKANASDAPVVYCTVFLLFLTVYFFIDHGISIKKKIIFGIASLIVVASFCIKEIELLWTAFIESHSYYFRFAFVVPMLMIMIGGTILEKIIKEGIDKKAMAETLVLLCVLFCLLKARGEMKSEGLTAILFTLAFLGYAGLLFFISYSRRYRVFFLAVLLICVSIELLYNAKIAFLDYKESYESYSLYVKEMEQLLQRLSEREENDFFRFEKNNSFNSMTGSSAASCESMLFGYNSLEHYSSAYDIGVDKFLAKMGYSDWIDGSVFQCETYWNNPMILMEALLSTRYVLWDEKIWGYSEPKGLKESYFQLDLYENRFALPLGFNVAETATEELPYGNNPFENQMMLFDAFAGGATGVYQEDELLYEGYNEDQDVESWKITMNEDGPAYLFIDGEAVHANAYWDNCRLLFNGQELKTCQRFSINTFYLGEYKKGTELNLGIKHLTGNPEPHMVYVVQLNTLAFEFTINQMKNNSTSDLYVERNRIYGKYKTGEDTIAFLSIPYEDNWKITVDGQKCKAVCIGNTFLGIPLSAGEHDIKMIYTASGVCLGICVSFVTLLVIICNYMVLISRRHDLAGWTMKFRQLLRR